MEYTKALIRANQPDSPNERDFNISDEGLDRHRSRIYADGWTTKNFMANPVIQYVHSANRVPNPDLVIGKGIKLWKEEKVMASRAKFDVDGEAETTNALAIKVLYKVDNGFLRATSVGFDPIEHSRGIKADGENPEEWYHRKQDLLEWSVVPVPSNPRALMRNLEEWRNFIDTEGLKGDDLNQFLRHGFQGAPLLHHLDGVDESNYRVTGPVNFYFDMPVQDFLKGGLVQGPIDTPITKKVEEVIPIENKTDIVDLADDFDLRYRHLKLKAIN